MGSQGIYTQTNVEKRRPYTVEQWHHLCQQTEHRPPEVKTERTARPVVTPRSRKRLKTDHSGKMSHRHQDKELYANLVV